MRNIIIAALLLAGCSARNSSNGGQMFVEIKNSPRSYMDPQVEKRSEALHHYLLGQLSFSRQDFPQALQNFAKASELIEEDAPSLHGQLAELYVREGKLPEALSEIQKALSGEPENEQYLLLAAGIFEALGRLDEAELNYKRVVDKNPKALEARVLLSGLYAKQKDFNAALALLKPMTNEPGFESMAYYYLGHVYEIQGDLKAAEREYLQAFERGGQSSNVVADILRLYLAQNRVPEAKKFCHRVLATDQNNVAARRILSHLLMGERNFDEALEQLEVLATLENDAADTRLKIALIRLEKQDFAAAERELLLILAKQPEQPDARYYLGSAYAAMGRNSEAVNELLKIKADQGDAYARSRAFAAFLLRQSGDLRAAEQTVREGLKAAPQDKKLFAYLMQLLRDQQRYEDALNLVQEEVERRPQEPDLWFEYGVLLNEVGREREAVEKMERVLELNSQHSDALNFVAYSNAAAGRDLEHALDMVQRALKQRPDDGYYQDTLGWIYFQMGRVHDAERELKRATELVKDDIVILEHYGDAAMRAGRQADAQTAYRAALELSGKKAASREERDALARIQDKLKKFEKSAAEAAR